MTSSCFGSMTREETREWRRPFRVDQRGANVPRHMPGPRSVASLIEPNHKAVRGADSPNCYETGRLTFCKVQFSESVEHILKCMSRRPSRIKDKCHPFFLRSGVFRRLLADCADQFPR